VGRHLAFAVGDGILEIAVRLLLSIRRFVTLNAQAFPHCGVFIPFLRVRCSATDRNNTDKWRAAGRRRTTHSWNRQRLPRKQHAGKRPPAAASKRTTVAL